MKIEWVSAVVGEAADVGNRSPGQLAMVQLFVSVPVTNRLTPSSWVTEKVSATVSVNVNRKTVANANPPVLRGLVRHAPVQVAGVGATGPANDIQTVSKCHRLPARSFAPSAGRVVATST
jgi:hypothetical protein